MLRSGPPHGPAFPGVMANGWQKPFGAGSVMRSRLSDSSAQFQEAKMAFFTFAIQLPFSVFPADPVNLIGGTA